MSDVAYPLSDEEITALAHYLAHLYEQAGALIEPACSRSFSYAFRCV